MNITTQQFYRALGGALMAVLIFALPVFADEADFVVDFETTPLFDEANFLPGSEVTRSVEVTNNTDGAKEIGAEAINTSDPDGFGDVLDLTISEGETELYSGSLSDFFDAGQVALSSVAGGGGSAEYDFTISFEGGASNPYQEAVMGFDIIIGFAGDEGGDDGDGEGEGGGDSGDTGDGGGGGGGGGSPPRGLTIRNEASIDVSETTATVFWNTSYESTSRVVYGTVSGVFDFPNPPDYGYPFSTDEFDTPADTNGVTSHSVTVTGLASGVTYYYRSISHASPDTVSFEHVFTTLPSSGGSGVPQSDGIGFGGEGDENEIDSGQANGGSVESFSNETSADQFAFGGEEESGLQTGESAGNIFATNDGSSESPDFAEEERGFFQLAFLGIGTSSWILILAGIVILFFVIVWRRKKKRGDK